MNKTRKVGCSQDSLPLMLSQSIVFFKKDYNISLNVHYKKFILYEVFIQESLFYFPSTYKSTQRSNFEFIINFSHGHSFFFLYLLFLNHLLLRLLHWQIDEERLSRAQGQFQGSLPPRLDPVLGTST